MSFKKYSFFRPEDIDDKTTVDQLSYVVDFYGDLEFTYFGKYKFTIENVKPLVEKSSIMDKEYWRGRKIIT